MQKTIVQNIISGITENNNNYVIFGDNREMYLGSIQYIISLNSDDYILAVDKKDSHREYMSYESVTRITEVPYTDTKTDAENFRCVC